MMKNILYIVLLGSILCGNLAVKAQTTTENTPTNVQDTSYIHGRPVYTFCYTPEDSAKALKQLPSTFVNAKPNLIERAEALAPFFHKLLMGEQQVKVLHLGDSHIAGRDYPNSVKAVLKQEWEPEQKDSADARFYFEYMAKNGARMKGYLTPERLKIIGQKQPDLVILSFGTNECHGMDYKEDVHYKQIEQTFDSLLAVCPDAAFLFTTPQGAYLNGKPNPMTEKCVATLKKFAADRNVAFWNIYEIAGENEALQNYISAGMLKKDRVHYTPSGYKLQGKLLGEAILTATPKK